MGNSVISAPQTEVGTAPSAEQPCSSAPFFPLLNLPLELRNMIYDYHLASMPDDFRSLLFLKPSLSLPRYDRYDMGNCKLPPLLNTCKQIREEAMSYNYRNITLAFEQHIYMLDFLYNIGPIGRSLIRSIRIPPITNLDNIYPQLMENLAELLALLLLAASTNLEHIEIPVIPAFDMIAKISSSFKAVPPWRVFLKESRKLNILRKIRGLKRVDVISIVSIQNVLQSREVLYENSQEGPVRGAKELKTLLTPDMTKPKGAEGECLTDLGKEVSRELYCIHPESYFPDIGGNEFPWKTCAQVWTERFKFFSNFLSKEEVGLLEERNKQWEELEDNIERLRRQIDPLRKRERWLGKRIQLLEDQIRLLEDQIRLLEKEMQPLEQIQLLEKEMQLLEEQTQQLGEVIQRLGRQIHSLKKQKRQLKKLKQDLENQIAMLGKVMQPVEEQMAILENQMLVVVED